MAVPPHGPLPARQGINGEKARKHMGRKVVACLGGLRRIGDHLSVKILSHPRWPLGVRGTVLAVPILALVGIGVFAMIREATTTSHVPTSARSRPAATPPPPAFTRAEEAYIQALWPIHGEVERSTVRLSLGKIFYKSNEMGPAELKGRVDTALAT